MFSLWKGLITPRIARREEVEQVLAEVAGAHGVPPTAIKSATRRAKVCSARDELCYRLRKMGWSTPRIGQFLNRDHTTILAADRRHKAFLQSILPG